jgi:hypothetical protein
VAEIRGETPETKATPEAKPPLEEVKPAPETQAAPPAATSSSTGATVPSEDSPSAGAPEPAAATQASMGDAISVDPGTDLPQGAVARTRAALTETDAAPTDAEIEAITPKLPHPDFDPCVRGRGSDLQSSLTSDANITPHPSLHPSHHQERPHG